MKERIAEAFKDLVEEENTYKVSVEAICKRAKVSKTTFYKYFPDKYAVTEYIVKKGITVPQRKLVYGIKEKSALKIKEHTTYLLARYYEDKEFYKILLEEEGHNSCKEYITREIISEMQRYLQNCTNKNYSEMDIDYISHCYATMFVDILKKWLNDERDAMPQTISSYFFFEF